MRPIDTVLVTGGAGFIGSHVVDILLKKRYHVVVLDHRKDRENIKARRVKVYRGDVRDLETVKSVVKEADAIIHMAALINVDHSILDPMPFYDTNVNGTVNVLEAARESEVISRVVYISTCEVLGTIHEGKADENHPIPEARSPYAASKFAAERYCISYHHAYGGYPGVTVVRGFNTYGPRQSAEARGAVIPKFITRILNGEPPIIFGDGKQTRDYMYVEDLAEGIVKALETPNLSGEVIHLATGKEVSIRGLATKIIQLCGGNMQPQFAEGRPGEITRSAGDYTKAKRLLDWLPNTDLDTGLKKTIEYFKKSKKP